MLDASNRRAERLRRVRAALAGAAVGGLMFAAIPASPAAAAGPNLIGDAACSQTYAYGTQGRIEGFPPNTAIDVLIRFDTASQESSPFYWQLYPTDANGRATFQVAFNENEPYTVGAFFFRDVNQNDRYDDGDQELANVKLIIDQPCTGGVARPK